MTIIRVIDVICFCSSFGIRSGFLRDELLFIFCFLPAPFLGISAYIPPCIPPRPQVFQQ